ncbi:DUF3182 family protein [Pseudomonas huanghezhanensis]|uniref:DUF3182 family protein n=1 Tax=Pseudomonas huanghezhanensis TaxID=3002903 RepID=UPI0022855357|nr:DUF3182 family protein [Pseudomonas sp. BSw22131]
MSGLYTSNAKSEVVLLSTHKTLATHEVAVHSALGAQIARLLGATFSGLYDPTLHKGAGLYFIPSDTLIGKDASEILSIRSVDDFFGGLIQHPFMATKAISHPLLKDATTTPKGWSERFFEDAADSVLRGFTVFNLGDAHRAGKQLLTQGPVRIKPVLATAGRGQIVARTETELDAAIKAQDAAEVQEWGLVLEEDLSDVITYSVGQIEVAGIVISYHGTQSLTQDNNGETVYGGSELCLVRGDYNELLKLGLDADVRKSVSQAMSYEKAAFDCFPGFLASRRNYDIAHGTNSRGQVCSGVLEQSWRIGGASPAEIQALEAFAADPGLNRISVSTHEIYGETTLPADANVLYEGDDPDVGFITKFTQVQPHDGTQ